MSYIKQAFKYQHEFWKYFIGFCFSFLGSQIIGAIFFFIAMAVKMVTDGTNAINLSDESSLMNIFDSNIMLPVFLIPFAIGILMLAGWMKWQHKQPIKYLFNAFGKLDYKKILFSFLLWGSITVIFTLVDYFMNPNDYVLNFHIVPFIILFIISIILIPLQTSFEELLFRGYLMQGIGVATKNRWVPLVVTSVVFGLMHSFNPEVAKTGPIIMVSYIGTGFLLGIMTLMDDGLELALGYHAANNLIIALLVTSDWSVFQTHSILKDVSDPKVGAEIFLPVFVVYPILLLIYGKVYKWTNWKERLFGKIKPPVTKLDDFEDTFL
ncbi:lysostaphin resistance A-like protein [Zhouia sp. PK063]|uniref:lysostaphin resistance A-like protein n=1 Tax=Zhouia sp. PK063 TaxID=3373602 RepID=UPI0037A8EFDC